ncbi:MAG: hypothetical protein AAFY88_29725 [Acidobacteriota bacterium]
MKVRAASLAILCAVTFVLWFGIGAHADSEARLENLSVRLDGQIHAKIVARRRGVSPPDPAGPGPAQAFLGSTFEKP